MSLDDTLPQAAAPRAGLLALFKLGAGQALQWRLLLLWLLALALPLLLMSLPLMIALNASIENSLLGVQLTESFNPAVLIELLTGLTQRGYTPAAGLPALIVLVLLLPWLSAATSRLLAGLTKLRPWLRCSASRCRRRAVVAAASKY